MSRKKPNIHYTYKTTCNVTGKYYIGMHSTSNMNDGYLGSGKKLRYSIRKYGKETHTREILEFFENREKLIEREIQLLTTDVLCDDNCMNMMNGGTGGYFSIAAVKKGAEVTRTKYKDFLKDWASKGALAKFKKHGISKKFVCDWTGKKHSKETIELMRQSSLGMCIGENNGQYGTCWIVRNGENKKIKKEELEVWIGEGWERGRKIKKLN